MVSARVTILCSNQRTRAAMSLFGQKKPTQLVTDTSNFFIGEPEAEAEVGENSRVRLIEVFEDYHDVLVDLGYKKFMVVGRKGSGKTAVAEWIKVRSEKDDNVKCEFAKGINLRLSSYLAEGSDGSNASERFFEWIILVTLTQMLVENKVLAERLDNNGQLRKFVAKNIGSVGMDGMEVQEIVEKKSLKVNALGLKRFVDGSFESGLERNAHKVDFYKVIPILKRVLVDLLRKAGEIQDVEYVVIFDDLDVGIKRSDKATLDSLMSLIRTARDYNQELFGRSGVKGKIILMLRKDISGVLKEGYADSAKIFSSYALELNWFEEETAKYAFDRSKLKGFIDKRIRINIQKNGLPCGGDPWHCLVSSDVGGAEDSFKYIAKRTYMNPRDLILLFKPLSSFKLSYPIRPGEMDRLLVAYSIERWDETKNELTFWFDSLEISKTYDALVRVVRSRGKPFTDYVSLRDSIKDRLGVSEVRADDIMDRLFEYSVIGMAEPGGFVFFKYREGHGDHYVLDKTKEIIVHRSVEMAITKKVS